MIEVKIPQEINQYDAKLVGPFTMRQALCGGIAALLSYGIYNGMKGTVSEETVIGLILLVSTPFALLGWVKPYGMRFEKFFIGILFNTLISSPKRYYQPKDMITELIEQGSHSITARPDDKDMSGKKKPAARERRKNKDTKEDLLKAQKKYKKYTFS